MNIIFQVIWIGWLLSEILLSRLLRAKPAKSKGLDRSSLRLIWLTIIISMVAVNISINIIPAPISKTNIPGYTGLVLIICGIIIRIIAIRTLGKFFTVNLAIRDGHRLIKKGLYKFVRHPSYSGTLLSFLGFGLSINDWPGLIIVTLPVFFSFIYRINIEEKMLLHQFGNEYAEYKKTTKRLIPKIY